MKNITEFSQMTKDEMLNVLNFVIARGQYIGLAPGTLNTIGDALLDFSERDKGPVKKELTDVFESLPEDQRAVILEKYSEAQSLRIQVSNYEGIWNRPDVAADKDNLYIFTDNTDRDSGTRIISRDSAYYQHYGDGKKDLHFPSVTTALIRGLDNAMPVSTQRWYHEGKKGPYGRWTDADLKEFKRVVGAEFDEIRKEMFDRARSAQIRGEEKPLHVYLPGGGDGFTGGRISAITEVRTPRLYAFLKDQAESLYFAADLFEALFVEHPNQGEYLRKIAFEAVKNSTNQPWFDLPISPAEYVVDMSISELKEVVTLHLPAMPKEQREAYLKDIITEGKGIDPLSPDQKIPEPEKAPEPKKELKETIGADTTLAYGVVLTSSPDAMRDEYKNWLKQNPAGVVAYRIFGDKTFSARTVGNNIIGNPFNWTKLGSEEKATEMFYEWLNTGNNFNEPHATEEFRKAIVDKLLSLPEGAPVLYYKDIGQPSHATVLGYFINHKDQLFQGEAVREAQEPAKAQAEELKAASQRRDINTYSTLQLFKILDNIVFPPLGENETFDQAAKEIETALAPGWMKELDEKQSKSYLIGVITNLPAEVQEYITSQAMTMNLKPSIFDESRFDAYTLGYGTKSMDDFRSMIPSSTRVIVDTRTWPYNGNTPHFNLNNMQAEFNREGIRVIHVPAMISKGPGKDKVPNPQFVEDIRKAVLDNPGKVVIVGSKSSPMMDTRGQFLGPKLEQSGISVGHIRQKYDYKTKTYETTPEVISQESLTSEMLRAKNLQITNGSFRSVIFDEKGNILESPGVTLEKRIASLREDRNIEGNWNYGTPVNVVETIAEGLPAAVREVSSHANFTFVLTHNSRELTSDDRQCKNNASNGIVIPIPEEKEKLHSPEYVRSLIHNRKVMDSIGRYILQQKASNPDSFDFEHVVVGFVGANIAALSNQRVQSQVAPEELTGADSDTLRDIRDNEYKVAVEPIDRGQGDIDVFCKLLLEAVQDIEKNNHNEFDPDNKRSIFSITSVVALGETGAGIAGATAGQALGLDTTLQCLNKFEHTIDNETLYGRKLKDRPALVNHLHLGYSNAPSKDELIMQIDHVREAGERKEGPGLKDRHILVLEALGFSNSDILLMHDLALLNNVELKEHNVITESGQVISSAAVDLMDFIELCGGYGIEEPLPGFYEGNILQAEIDVEKKLVNERRNGIGVMTVANPLYPEQFRSFEGFSKDVERESYEVVNGVAHAEITREEIKEKRPAIIRFRGNIDALSAPAVSVIGNDVSSEEARRAAAHIGRELARSGVTVVSSFRQMDYVRHNTKITSKELLGKVYDQDIEEQELKKEDARRDSASAARDAAIDAGASAIVISPNSLTFTPDEDQIQRVISSGGLVVSEADFESGVGNERLRQRANYLGCALGGNVVLIDGRSNNSVKPASVAVEASKGEVYAVRYAGIEGVNPDIRANEDLIRQGAPTIDPSGQGIQGIVSASQFGSTSKALEEFIEKEETERENRRAVKIERHVDRYRFNVVRSGNHQVFVVPSNYPDVRDAVRQAYGEDVEFADNIGLCLRNMENGTRLVEGEMVNTATPSHRTEVIKDPVYSMPLFYSHGKVYSYSNAPAGTPTLVSQKRRIQSKEIFDELCKRAEETRRAMNKAVGLPENALFRFENALYPVVTPASINIYEGPALRAQICIGHNGSLEVRNYESLKNDLYNEFFSIDPYEKEATGAGQDVRDVIEHAEEKEETNGNRTFEEALFNEAEFNKKLRDLTEINKKSIIDELSERIHLKLVGLQSDAKNLEIAAKDAVKGIENGTVGVIKADKSDEEKDLDVRYDKKVAVTSLKTEEAELVTELHRLEKKASGIANEINAINGKYNTEKTDNNNILNVNSAEISNEDKEALQELIEERDALRMEMTALRERIGVLRDMVERTVMAEKISVMGVQNEGKHLKVTLCIDGLVVGISPNKVRKNLPQDMVDKTISDIKARVEHERQVFDEGIERVETRSITIAKLGELHDKRSKESKWGVAEKREIVPESFKNGRYVIKRDGKMAYADEQLNIRSEFYDSVHRWSGSNGLVKKDGKYNFIDPDGKPIVEVWFDERGQARESLFVIRVGNEYGIVGGDGALVGGRLYENARDSHDGWCVIKAGPADGEHAGKYNFINADGELYPTKQWFDSVSDFSEGKATAIIGNTRYELHSDRSFSILDDGMGGAGGGATAISKGRK